jgi:tetratricopeptide (TPR) repeat protein
VIECDRLAASDIDPERPLSVPGVLVSALGAPAATACQAAVQIAPDNRRLLFQLGRAYDALKDYEKARAQYIRADALGHLIAANNLGILYDRGAGGPHDPAQARRLSEGAAHWTNEKAPVRGSRPGLCNGTRIDIMPMLFQ